jgi:hypothetical protein
MSFQDTTFGDWEIISPHRNYLGLSYGEWVRNWMNWLLRENPDDHNNGPVVYIRGVDFNKSSGGYNSFIRIGKDRLTMSMDQAALFAVILCFADARHHPELSDRDDRLSKIFHLIINGDHPPESRQFMVNDSQFPIGLDDFLVVSPEFKLHVPPPSSSYGSTLGPFLDVPMIYEGDWDCNVTGYFVLMKPKKPGRYTIASNATAEDGWHTETFVEIEVADQSRSGRASFDSERMKEAVGDVLRNQGTGLPPSGIPVKTSLSANLGMDENFSTLIDNGHGQSSEKRRLSRGSTIKNK